MITAVDTNILLDVLLQDPTFAASSEEALRRSAREGAQVICDIVYAELAGLFPSHSQLETFLKDTGVQLVSFQTGALWRAGELWRRFCLGKKAKAHASRRILADFLIGAHAFSQADRLLTRDKDFYHSVFSGLRII